MFISIVCDECSSLYQCDRFHVHRVKGKPDELTITMERDGRSESVCATIDKSDPGTLGVYIMNDNGRTIDTIFSGNG